MSKDIVQLTDKEIDDILFPQMIECIKDVYDKYASVMAGFYNDYPKPKIYRRSGGLKSLIKYKDERIKNGHQLTFIFDAENMTYKEAHQSILGVYTTGYIYAFNSSFIHGNHGYGRFRAYKGGSAVMTTPSPWMQILSYVKTKYNGFEVD